MKIRRVIIATLTIYACQVWGADYATTDGGRRVRLSSDGTWSYEQSVGSNGYRQIEFSDFLIDGEKLIGKSIKIRGVGGFSNDRGQARPDGSIYQKTFTIGPSIWITSKDLDRSNLASVHECPLSCALEISGVVEKSQYNMLVIRAEAVKVTKKGAAQL